MAYEQSCALSTDAHTAMERARMMLGTRGFALKVSGGQLLAQGPPLQFVGQDPVLGAGRLMLALGGEQARLTADLSGLSRLRNLALFGPAIIAVLLGAGMTAAGVDNAMRPALLNAILCMLLGPLLAWWLRRRTERALAALLTNISRP